MQKSGRRPTPHMQDRICSRGGMGAFVCRGLKRMRKRRKQMSTLPAIGSGLAGAWALNVLRETARQVVPAAPPRGRHLYRWTLAGDLLSNRRYSSMVGMGDPAGAWRRGIPLGLIAGVGGVLLPGPLGLGYSASARRPATATMTVGWYRAGGLAAAAAHSVAGSLRSPTQWIHRPFAGHGGGLDILPDRWPIARRRRRAPNCR